MSEAQAPKDFSGLKVRNARVIPWELEGAVGFGVAVEYEGREHAAYGIGSMREAEKEVQRLLKLEPLDEKSLDAVSRDCPL